MLSCSNSNDKQQSASTLSCNNFQSTTLPLVLMAVIFLKKKILQINIQIAKKINLSSSISSTFFLYSQKNVFTRTAQPTDRASATFPNRENFNSIFISQKFYSLDTAKFSTIVTIDKCCLSNQTKDSMIKIRIIGDKKQQRNLKFQ